MSIIPKFEKVKTQKNKQLNLFVGLYYTISVKSIPNCLVTYEPEPRESTNLMQIATDVFDTEQLDNKFLWTILPSGQDNNYFLKVLSLPEGILTYSHSLSWGGRYLELDLTHPESYKPGATMHESALWHFEQSELQDYYTIHNSDTRRNVNFVTFSNEPSTNGQLMQIGCKELNYYEPKGKFRHDALWNFRPANFELHALVKDFKLEAPTQEELKSASVPIRITEEIVIKNDTDSNHVELHESVKLPEQFVLYFLQSFKPFKEQNVKIDTKALEPLTNQPQNFQKLTNTQWHCTKERDFKLPDKLLIDKNASASVTGYCDWIYNVEIPFKGIVEISATADVAYCPTPVELHCSNERILDCSVIECLVKYQKFTGKVVGGKEGVVVCEVGGRVKCSFGLGTKLEVKYL